MKEQKEQEQIKNSLNHLDIKLRNLTFIVVFCFVVIVLLIIGLYFKDGKTTNNGGSGTASNGSETSVKYDVSKMKKVTGDEAAKLFDEKGTHFLYIGRSTCSVCINLVPELNTVINDMTLTINYLPLTSTFRDDFKNLFDKLTIETKITSNGKTYEGTYGEILHEGGFTPIVVVIKDGKMVEGFVGYREANKIKEIFQKYM